MVQTHNITAWDVAFQVEWGGSSWKGALFTAACYLVPIQVCQIEPDGRAVSILAFCVVWHISRPVQKTWRQSFLEASRVEAIASN